MPLHMHVSAVQHTVRAASHSDGEFTRAAHLQIAVCLAARQRPLGLNTRTIRGSRAINTLHCRSLSSAPVYGGVLRFTAFSSSLLHSLRPRSHHCFAIIASSGAERRRILCREYRHCSQQTQPPYSVAGRYLSSQNGRTHSRGTGRHQPEVTSPVRTEWWYQEW